MITLPNEVSLSRSTTNKFAVIKQRTGITPNLMGRVALMKALESNVNFGDLKSVESDGQKIPKDIFFGEEIDIYRLAIELYMAEQSIEADYKEIINGLVEYGAHMIPIVKTIIDLKNLEKVG